MDAGNEGQTVKKYNAAKIQWKLVEERKKQFFDGDTGFDLPGDDYDDKPFRYVTLPKLFTRASNTELFNWKWSPCGRYGADMPGGRDQVKIDTVDKIAVFDIHMLSWSLYDVRNYQFSIPRVAFMYWISKTMLVCVSLELTEEIRDDSADVPFVFRQTMFSVDHDMEEMIPLQSVFYFTDRYISIPTWYHIFHDRVGEPFIDHNQDKWLVFSNTVDSLILIPYVPGNDIKYVSFDMNDIMSSILGENCEVDSFPSSHFVPYVHDQFIHFFIRIDKETFRKLHNNGYLARRRPELDGIYQIQVDLRRVLNTDDVHEFLRTNNRINKEDVIFHRKVIDEIEDHRVVYTQNGRRLILANIVPNLTMTASQKRMKASDWVFLKEFISWKYRESVENVYFISIDLHTGELRRFYCLLLESDVISPHPSGAVLMFRYREDYSMRIGEMPCFSPLPLTILCRHVLNDVIDIDPKFIQDKLAEKELSLNFFAPLLTVFSITVFT
ncbi:unnamed protein product [Caenorhabditis bovis]|uniref:Uncharacterized protein n=1 Tax=Caenorhabditis bovis TaxID=2654633 RepID=A0A8S1EZ94_9PELO|nr:unnamed protein product [Caenorhabditis bovis]